MRRTLVIATLTFAAAAVAALAGGCIEHHVTADPIQINVDVNLRVDERLQQFFEYENELRRRLLEQQDKDAAAREAAPGIAPVKESN